MPREGTGRPSADRSESGGDRDARRPTRSSTDPATTPASSAGDRPGEWNETWALAIAFGVASIPWTYAFVAELHLPLWPSFVASASFFAAGGGVGGLVRGYLGNLTGIAYAAATIAAVGAVGGGAATLSVVVGAFMLLASLHAFVPRLSFTPGAFFGYATMFGVHAGGASAFGITGLAGESTAAVVAMLLGACIGLATERVSRELS